jgi:ribosomal subunit interface protein
VEIVVRGRHLDLSDHFREHTVHKLTKVERYDTKVQRIDVEVSKETNPRIADRAVTVQLTCRGRGPVIRAEAAADEMYAALDAAAAKLEERMRRTAERRRAHRSDHRGADEPAVNGERPAGRPSPAEREGGGVSDSAAVVGAGLTVDGDGPLVVREKIHPAVPMRLDQALEAMELVGHDFYLFADAATGRPSVVYRRKGYDYGVIGLEVEPATEGH